MPSWSSYWLLLAAPLVPVAFLLAGLHVARRRRRRDAPATEHPVEASASRRLSLADDEPARPQPAQPEPAMDATAPRAGPELELILNREDPPGDAPSFPVADEEKRRAVG